MRDAAINLRALPEQRDLIDQAASALGKNRSDFMLEAACERAQSVLLDRIFFSLDTDKFQQFIALLDAPPTPNVGLERLMAIKAPWD
ncbi:MAG: DUF1778 domain-containing protein [Lamprobacter sp.]|uniref:type II toxin-antitoxin system TacA family antitoxin n=1 Tax=Lamprobacter sp. TaxID=3100796 RepID=UPI002B2603F0|nr:DUF1778 domain-containing protein [Lamprobacter sp.]MEA3643028.1 DUF1778 domain-containing protein [Lamprobacter sp.]